MSRKLSNRQVGYILAGSALLALGLGSGIKLLTGVATDTQTATTASEPVAAPTELAEAGSTAFQAGPFVPSSRSLRLADPTLLKSTSKEARLETVAAGRPDPFASMVLPGPGRPKPAATAPVAAVAAVPPPVQTLPVIPVTATQALPPLPAAAPPLPSLGPVAAAPLLPMPNLGLPSAPPVSLVDRVEISGVAQIGSTVNVIIREPGATTSRYVRAGDAIAGGQVRVKRIDLSNAEPTVVLEYQGQEFYRSVGSTTLAGLF